MVRTAKSAPYLGNVGLLVLRGILKAKAALGMSLTVYLPLSKWLKDIIKS